MVLFYFWIPNLEIRFSQFPDLQSQHPYESTMVNSVIRHLLHFTSSFHDCEFIMRSRASSPARTCRNNNFLWCRIYVASFALPGIGGPHCWDIVKFATLQPANDCYREFTTTHLPNLNDVALNYSRLIHVNPLGTSFLRSSNYL